MNRTEDFPKLWIGSFIKICLVNFLIFVNFHALLSTFPFFISSLGGDIVAIGLATALFSIAPILSRPFVGWLVDTQGRRLVLICGLAGVAFVPMGYFISAGIATVDTPLKLGELFEPMSVPAAVTQLSFMMVYGVVEVYVAIYAILHCLPSEGIYFIGIAVATVATRILLGRVVVSPVRRDWCTQEMQPLSPGYFCWYSRTTYRATCCWQHCWDTVSELCSLPCRPWSCLPKDEVPQALRFSWLSISGLHWEDFSQDYS